MAESLGSFLRCEPDIVCVRQTGVWKLQSLDLNRPGPILGNGMES